jgi:outer membrane protein
MIMILSRRLLPVLLSGLFFCSCALAQDNTPSPVPSKPMLQVPGPVGEVPPPPPESAKLSLEECVVRALDKNFAIRIQSIAVSQAKDAVIITQAAYDPIFGANWQKAVSQSPIIFYSTSTTVGGSKPTTDNQSTTLTLTQPVITGGTVTANYQLGRNASNTVQTLLNPSYDGLASINITQPLLQGAGVDYNRATIQIAQLGEKIAGLNLKSSILSTIYNVETAYFNLVYARKQYLVALDSVKLAQQLLDENIAKRNTGVLTDLDVVQAQAGLATSQSQVIGFKQAMDNAADTLQQALGEREFTSSVGSVEFPALTPTTPSFAYSYKLARDNGPNLAVIQDTIEQYKLQALRAKRLNQPSLNAIGGAGYTSAEHSYTDANSTVWSGPGYNWNVGLAVNIPLGMRATRAQYRQALANVESEQTALEQVDQTLMVQVRAAVRAVESNQQGVEAATQTVVLSQKQYELQKAKFDAGVATSFLVLQAQTQLETARLTLLQAETNLRQALANLRFLEGTSLDVYRVTFGNK